MKSAIIFWSIAIGIPVILFIAFPWLMIPYFIAGGIAAGIYIGEFGKDKEVGGILAALLFPHLYYLVRFVIGPGFKL